MVLVCIIACGLPSKTVSSGSARHAKFTAETHSRTRSLSVIFAQGWDGAGQRIKRWMSLSGSLQALQFCHHSVFCIGLAFFFFFKLKALSQGFRVC